MYVKWYCFSVSLRLSSNSILLQFQFVGVFTTQHIHQYTETQFSIFIVLQTFIPFSYFLSSSSSICALIHFLIALHLNQFSVLMLLHYNLMYHPSIHAHCTLHNAHTNFNHFPFLAKCDLVIKLLKICFWLCVSSRFHRIKKKSISASFV